MITGRLRRGITLGLVVALASIAVPAIRHSILRAAGRRLVVNECTGLADIIVISGEADGAGVLVVSDLVLSGVATRVAVFTYARMPWNESSLAGVSHTKTGPHDLFDN